VPRGRPHNLPLVTRTPILAAPYSLQRLSGRAVALGHQIYHFSVTDNAVGGTPYQHSCIIRSGVSSQLQTPYENFIVSKDVLELR